MPDGRRKHPRKDEADHLAGDVPVYYQPESGQPGVSRDAAPEGAGERDDRNGAEEQSERRILHDEKEDD